MLLSRAPVNVLTLRVEDHWHLPRFVYDPDAPYDPTNCVRDLEQCLGFSYDPPFSHFEIVAELCPPEENNLNPYVNPSGRNCLTLLEATQPFAKELPANAQWTDVSHILETVCDEECFFLLLLRSFRCL